MQEIRCKNCNKLLFKGVFNRVEVKCPRCKRLVSISNAAEHPTELNSGKREQITRTNEA
ncbi:Com family DNA-binding transcriptional regulator [Erwinia sp. HR93]|uniref:Com family DNA-binding transcriptional regulator n=1 Tax=Erwinia sp. HR93 TaxID=3094840 RepID=UPI002ADEE7FD|nr:Com family DNA-binding transcriptional regulator [Erwinia sp. HR93]MEA1065824.1 Com family DNA-binding transcriptional regulator [Erwinia sp. HR93]